MKILEDLLTLADRGEYYEGGIKPWVRPPNGKPPERSAEELSKDATKAHDNIKRLLGENDKLIANQFKLRTELRVVIFCAVVVVIAAWSPLWLPLLLKLAK